jgi:hypothetical protein
MYNDFMASKSVTLRLPESLVLEATKLAKSGGMSFNRFSEQLYREALRLEREKRLTKEFEAIAADIVEDDDAWNRLGRETLDHD